MYLTQIPFLSQMQTNTLQAVLLTDGAQSFVIYNYKEIRWGIAPDQREWAQVLHPLSPWKIFRMAPPLFYSTRNIG